MLRTDGVIEILGAAALWALLSLTIDRFLELPRLARGGALLGLVALLGFLAFSLLRRLRAPIGPEALAAAVERRFPDLQGQLQNALAFRRDLEGAGGGSPLEKALLQRALAEAERAAAGVRFGGALNLRPFLARAAGALGALGLGAVLIFLVPATVKLWFQRNVLLAAQEWPRATRLELDREDAVWHCPRGESLALEGWARGKVPAELRVHIRAPGGSRHAAIAPAPNGRFSFTIPEVLEPFDFHVRGGDGRTESRRVEVHDRPRVLSLSFALTFPEYLGRSPETIENVAGEVSVPAGTRARLVARADMPLLRGFLTLSWEKGQRLELAPIGPGGEEAARVEHEFEPRQSGSIDLTVVDAAWKLESRPPLRARFLVKPDAVPRITLALKQKTRLVTPMATVPYRVEAKDDHGFTRLGLEVVISSSGDSPHKELIAFEDLPPRQGEVAREDELALEPFDLEPGLRLTLTAEGADNDGIAGPKIARSNSEVLQVVAPDEFREAMARARAAARRELEDALAREERLGRELEDSPRPRAASVKTGDEGGQGGQGARGGEGGRGGKGGKGGKGAKGGKGSKDAKVAKATKDAEGEKAKDAEGAKDAEEAKDAPEAESPEDARVASSAQGGEGARGGQGAGGARGGQGARGGPADQGQAAGEGGSQEPTSPREGGARNGGAKDGGARPAAARAAATPSGLSREQSEVGQKVRKATEELRAIAEAMEENRMLGEAERRRFEAEIAGPLGELGEERFPRTARDIAEIPKAEDPEAARARARAEVGRIADSMRAVLDRLADTEDFADVLNRLEGVLGLHRQVIATTRERTGPPGEAPPPAVAPSSPPRVAPSPPPSRAPGPIPGGPTGSEGSKKEADSKPKKARKERKI